MTEYNWELKSDPIPSADPFYDATSGGYIKPHELLVDQELADEVVAALELVEEFLEMVTEEM